MTRKKIERFCKSIGVQGHIRAMTLADHSIRVYAGVQRSPEVMKLSDAFIDTGEHQARIQPVEVNVQVITDRNANGMLSKFISLSKEVDYLVKT